MNLMSLLSIFFNIFFFKSSNLMESKKQKNEEGIKEILSLFTSLHQEKVQIKRIKAYDWRNPYDHILLGSLTPYLFESLEIHENIVPEGHENRPGTIKEKKYICVHDTGDGAFNAHQWSKIVHDGKFPGGGIYENSFQYVVGNDGIWHNIPDNEVAYHAGDGVDYDYEEIPSCIFGNEKHPIITISNDGYYEINGNKSCVKCPLNDKGEIPINSDINEHGVRCVVKDGQYYLGLTWWSNTHKKIGNRGGNVNSIGIESCLNKGSDIFLTWMKLAKLVAYLMDKNKFSIDDVVSHHFFSGKNCPKTIKDNGFWKYFLDTMVMTEYKLLKYINDGYTISIESKNKDLIDENGKVIKRPEHSTEVEYNIIVIKEDMIDFKTFKSIIPGEDEDIETIDGFYN